MSLSILLGLYLLELSSELGTYQNIIVYPVNFPMTIGDNKQSPR